MGNMHFLKSCSGILGLVSLSLGVEWVDICTSSSGKQCCASDDTGMGNASARHRYWIMLDQGSVQNLDLLCRTEESHSRLAVFESQRENDCVTKYIIDKETSESPWIPLTSAVCPRHQMS